MSGQSGASVRIAIKGRVLTAPIGTTAPVDVVSAWPTGWNDHGYTDQNGVTVTPKITSYDVKAWQSDTPVRSRIVERIREIGFKLIQGGGLNSVLFNGGGAWSQTPTRSVSDGVLNGTTTVTSATAAFATTDVGASIAGVGIPAGATITVRGSATSVTISAAASISATGVGLTIGAVGTYLYTPPTPGTDDNRMLGIEWVDGTVTKREVYPQALVINVSGYSLKANGEIQYDITIRANSDTWFVLSNDPLDAMPLVA